VDEGVAYVSVIVKANTNKTTFPSTRRLISSSSSGGAGGRYWASGDSLCLDILLVPIKSQLKNQIIHCSGVYLA